HPRARARLRRERGRALGPALQRAGGARRVRARPARRGAPAHPGRDGRAGRGGGPAQLRRVSRGTVLRQRRGGAASGRTHAVDARAATRRTVTPEGWGERPNAVRTPPNGWRSAVAFGCPLPSIASRCSRRHRRSRMPRRRRPSPLLLAPLAVAVPAALVGSAPAAAADPVMQSFDCADGPEAVEVPVDVETLTVMVGGARGEPAI